MCMLAKQKSTSQIGFFTKFEDQFKRTLTTIRLEKHASTRLMRNPG